MATGINGRNISCAVCNVSPSVALSEEIAITFPIHATGRMSLVREKKKKKKKKVRQENKEKTTTIQTHIE